jgi:selenide,water dikinase
LSQLAPVVDPRLLVGSDTLDDAAAIRLSDELAICFTADFITPLVDDPNRWGRIAAANSISDIYAMGARPLAALNLVGWPGNLDADELAQVLAGGREAADEAGCLVVGGHTIKDSEPKFGLAVIGTVHPDRILRNRGALAGDLLYLSKPLGTGILTTAVKRGKASDEELDEAVRSMCALNRAAAEAAVEASVRALTDVTGFGLAGHLTEMLGPDGALGAEISLGALPLLPGAARHLADGMIPGGAQRNREAYAQRLHVGQGVEEGAAMLLFDPQTSGGLLAAVPPEAAERFEQESAQRGVSVTRIGTFTDTGRIDLVS